MASSCDLRIHHELPCGFKGFNAVFNSKVQNYRIRAQTFPIIRASCTASYRIEPRFKSTAKKKDKIFVRNLRDVLVYFSRSSFSVPKHKRALMYLHLCAP